MNSDAAVVAVRIDPAAKRDFLADLLRPQAGRKCECEARQDSERKA